MTYYIFQVYCRSNFISAALIFYLPGFEAAITHHDALGDADQFHVREHYAGTLVAIVEQHVDSRGQEFGIDAFSSFTDGG